jgi:hypothetical protein
MGSLVNEPCPISAAGDTTVMVPSGDIVSQYSGHTARSRPARRQTQIRTAPADIAHDLEAARPCPARRGPLAAIPAGESPAVRTTEATK